MHECRQEERLRVLEQSDACMGIEIKNLIGKLSELTGWIKALILTVIPVLLSALGLLLVYWIKG